MDDTAMKKAKTEAADYIEANQEIFVDISHQIWQYAELSLKEYRSAELYCKILKENGFTVKENICGIATAFTGHYGSGKPIIGILAEFDALSGLSQQGGATEAKPIVAGGNGHGCGHNMLGAGSLAAAMAVKQYLEQTKKSGTIVFFGCPGEEGGASKAFMAREGVWRSLDAALTWHPGDTNEIVSGTCNSCIQVLYQFHGVAAHAASDPEQGRSALDAVELMNVGVQFLREHMISDARIHYSILNNGGISPNVVQAEASVLYMIRAIAVKDTVALASRVDKIAAGAAMMTETTFEKVFVDGTANTLPNTTLEKLLYKNMCEVGAPSYTSEETAFADALYQTYPHAACPAQAGRLDKAIAAYVDEKTHHGAKSINDFVVPFLTTDAFTPGSTDVGDVSWQTPTAQIKTVTYPSGAPGHSWQNVSCGVTSLGDKGLLYAGKVLACAVIELWENPAILEEARAEFVKREADGHGYVCPIPADVVPVAMEI